MRTTAHFLEGKSWPQVSDSIRGQEAHGNSLTGRDDMAARQGFNSRPGGARQLTDWKGKHGRTSGIQFEARRRTATHILEGKSWPHVRDSIRSQEAHGNSHPGMESMRSCQGFNSRPGGARQLTNWKGKHGRTSCIQFEARRRTATHILEGKPWPHVRDSIRGQEAHVNSHTGREGMAARQGFNSRPGGARQLTFWKVLHGRTYGIQF